MGFVRMPLTEDGLTTTVIHREPFAIVLPKAHPLVEKNDLTVKDLAPEPFIAYGKRWAPSFHERWIELCLDAGFAPRVVQETGEMSTALALVAAGLGQGSISLIRSCSMVVLVGLELTRFYFLHESNSIGFFAEGSSSNDPSRRLRER